MAQWLLWSQQQGRILAMASTPSYDPNALASHDTSAVSDTYSSLTQSAFSPLINRATRQLYSPGSTLRLWWLQQLWSQVNTTQIP